MKRTLYLSLKKKWFDMWKCGIKKEDYREITLYWIKRFVFLDAFYFGKNPSNEDIKEIVKTILEYKDTDFFNEFDEVVFTCGYPRKDDSERRMTFPKPQIRIGYGKPEWGAEEGKMYFIIKPKP